MWPKRKPLDRFQMDLDDFQEALEDTFVLRSLSRILCVLFVIIQWAGGVAWAESKL